MPGEYRPKLSGAVFHEKLILVKACSISSCQSHPHLITPHFISIIIRVDGDHMPQPALNGGHSLTGRTTTTGHVLPSHVERRITRPTDLGRLQKGHETANNDDESIWYLSGSTNQRR